MLLGKLELSCIPSCIHRWLKLQFVQWCGTIRPSWAPGLDIQQDENEKFTVTRLGDVLDSLRNLTVLCIRVAQPCLSSLSFTPVLRSWPFITQTRRFSSTSTTSSEPMGAMTRSPASCFAVVPFQSQNVPHWGLAPLRVHVDHVAYRPQQTDDVKGETVSTAASVGCDLLKRKTMLGYRIHL